MEYLEVFITALKLGLTSFGGPVAHLGYFRDEYVRKKKWLSEEAYADLVTLCQFLPGPASSQVGMAIGYSRKGLTGAALSWLGFTIPSALILTLWGLGIKNADLVKNHQWLHGLKIVAVAIVAQAVYGMSRKLCPDKARITLALLSCLCSLTGGSALSQILLLFMAGIFGAFYFKESPSLPHEPVHRGSPHHGALFLVLFFGLLLFLPMIRSTSSHHGIALFDSFYRAGSLVFGGGHIILPLLQTEVVSPGWISKDLFIAGYGAANAIPGPLFAFSSFIGAASSLSPNGWTGALICLVAAFLPSFLLIFGVLPYWERIRKLPKIRSAMMATNASVVGLLLAVLYNPVWTSAILSIKDFSVAALGFMLLEFWKLPSWLVVFLVVSVSLF